MKLTQSTCFGKMSRASSARKTMPLGASLPLSLERMPPSLAHTNQDGGRVSVWLPDQNGAWRGELRIYSTTECPSADAECSSSLSEILEPSVPPRYYLSGKACAGILRRAEKRGRELPKALREALEAVAQTTTERKLDSTCPRYPPHSDAE